MLEKALRSMVESGQNAVIYGERRVGKTSLALHVAKKLKKSRLVYIDFLACHTAGDLTERIAKAVLEASKKGRFFDTALKTFSSLRPVVSLDPNTGSPSVTLGSAAALEDPIGSLEEALDRLNELHGKLPIIAVFDEFQQVLEVEKSDQAIARMRSRIQMHGTLPYIFTGSVREGMQSIFNDSRSPFYKSALSLEVEALERSRFDKYLTKKFASGDREISPGLFDSIGNLGIRMTGDVQELCWALWMSSSPGDEVGEEHFESALEMIHSVESRNYEDNVSLLAPSQMKVLLTIAKLGGVSLYSNSFKSAARISSNSAISKAAKRLVSLRLLYKHKGAYHFANPFFGIWLVRKF